MSNQAPSSSLPVSPSPHLPVRSVAIIGAGRLGGALAVALDAAGYHLNALVAHRLAHAKQAARGCSNSRPLALSSSQLDQLPESDLLIITTPDDLIGEVAGQLAEALSAASWPLLTGRHRRRTALHMSGALASDVLLPLRARGFAIGSLHPLA
ncbi:MAG: NAD(P)-binding domain-containing protein, partial [Pyrinomonadaceae bacterium]|nr:NAD(P)-binding domain-containing protein [Pyrinomonadaceae bacterium]